MLDQQESIFQSNVYSKSELQLLCKAYGLVFRRSDSKALLSEQLVPKIRESRYVPHPQTLENPSQQPGPSRQTETTVSENMATNETGSQPGTVIYTEYNKVKYFLPYSIKFLFLKDALVSML